VLLLDLTAAFSLFTAVQILVASVSKNILIFRKWQAQRLFVQESND
jgi:hypothetical protein